MYVLEHPAATASEEVNSFDRGVYFIILDRQAVCVFTPVCRSLMPDRLSKFNCEMWK